jgi:hypothetical protein
MWCFNNFLESHGLIETTLVGVETSSYIQATPINEHREEILFVPIKGENYMSRPNLLYFAQGFNVSNRYSSIIA